MASLAEINKTLKEQTSAIEYGNEGTDDLRMKFGAFVDSMQGNAGDRREKEYKQAECPEQAELEQLDHEEWPEVLEQVLVGC